MAERGLYGAKKARDVGVRQFIFMLSMIIYGSQECIDEHTLPQSENFLRQQQMAGRQGDKGAWFGHIRRRGSQVSYDLRKREQREFPGAGKAGKDNCSVPKDE